MSSQSKLQVNEREGGGGGGGGGGGAGGGGGGGGGGGMLQPSTYLKPTSFPGPLPLPFFNGQGLARERG